MMSITIMLQLLIYLVGEYMQEAGVLNALMHVSDTRCGVLEFYLGKNK